MDSTKLYVEIARLVESLNNEQFADHWRDRAEQRLYFIERDCLPSGSGIDSGCKVDLGRSRIDRIVICTDYHHMSEHGYYTRWTHHDIIVKPSLQHGFTLDIKGIDHNGIKDYLHEVFYIVLNGDYSNFIDGLMLDHYS